MKKRWIPFIVIAAMLGIGSIATADETEMDFYISEDDSEEVLVATAEEDEDPFAVDGLIEDLEAADGETGDIPIDEDHFPDENFRAYISDNFDLPDSEGNKDGVLSADEIAAVTEMNIPDNVSDISGFTVFTALEILDARGLRDYNYRLTFNLPSLKSIYLSNCGGVFCDLQFLNCTSLTTLIINDSTFKELQIYGCTNLTSIEINNSKRISSVFCSNTPINQFITKKGQNRVRSLDCSSNQLTSLDVSALESLHVLNCSNNMLTQLDITHCPYLVTAYNKGTCTNKNGVSTYYVDDMNVETGVEIEAELTCDSSTPLITNNHRLGAWKITKAATALSTGLKVRTCDNCDYKLSQTIPKLKASVTLNKAKLKLKKGKKATLKIKSMTKGDQILKWTTSKKKIATVNKKGQVKAKKKGKCVITVVMKSGAKAKCTITVK